jgi:hypothetical protein
MAQAKAPTLHFFETEWFPAARVVLRARGLAKSLFDPYHPELHYMRGPGPKWREKHGLAPEAAIVDPRDSGIWKDGA